MPNFQGAVNEVINQAGLYSSLAGGPQDLKERIRLGKEEKVATKQMNNLIGDIAETSKQLDRVKETGDFSAMPGIAERLDAQGKELERVKGDITGIRERRYQLSPSEKNYEAYMRAKSRTGTKPLSEDPEIIHGMRMAGVTDEARRAAEYDHAYREAYNQEFSRIDKMNQAMDRVGRQSEAKKTQKRKFMDYLAQQPTSLGGTVGDLPKPLQKQVASQYTKSQRKTMMDRMDEEANDGKQK